MKKLILPLLGLSLAACLSACNSSAPPQASDQPTVVTITGKVASPSGTGKITVPTVASATTNSAADGSFSLDLPPAAALSNLTLTAEQVMSGLSCTGKLTSSDAAAKGYLVVGLTLQDSAGVCTVFALTGSKTGLLSRGVTGKVWLYADRATTLSGTVDCASLLNVPQIKALPVTVAVNAKTGWNTVDLNIGASSNFLGHVSASGSAVNSPTSSSNTTWRTMSEVQSQISF